ncbi:MAG: hypothetical protein ABIP45_04885 [Knoellia sp.]
MTYQVQVKDLRDSAKAARSAASQISEITPGTSLSGAKPSMPGAPSVNAMQRVSSGWSTELAGWAKSVRAYGRNLDTNATQYELDDDAARAAFGPLGKKKD